MKNKTRICCIDASEEIIEFLKEQDYDVFNGSFGTRINVETSNAKNSFSYLLLNYFFPENIHEYDLFVIDMNSYRKKNYQEWEHRHSDITNGEARYFYSQRPSTVFNPIPYSSKCFNVLLSSHINKAKIKIVFQAEKEDVEYLYGENPYHPSHSRYSNYDFTYDHTCEVLSGVDVKVVDNDISRILFQKHVDEVSYCQTFYNRNSDNYLPLLKNGTGDIVSYLYCSKEEVVFMLPQIKDKVSLLKTLFNEVLYKNLSEYFPNNTNGSWKQKEEYYLPNHQNLLNEKETITKKYEKDIAQLDNEIKENNEKYLFLHNLLTETGDNLVKAAIEYLQWLGFDNVVDKDTTAKDGLLEEDIQIELGEKGLLVIEVKGINGTSTDAECSQIHKIVHRRGKERGKYDVMGLYIVNNERNIEPLMRTMPPFNDTQIQDAINDERGLVYTWQLFNLYYNIENGFISKEEARQRLLKPGLINFTPNSQSIGVPYNILKDGSVICIELNGHRLAKGQTVVFENNGRYEKRTIMNIQQDHKDVQFCDTGKVGIEVDQVVYKVKELFLLN